MVWYLSGLAMVTPALSEMWSFQHFSSLTPPLSPPPQKTEKIWKIECLAINIYPLQKIMMFVVYLGQHSFIISQSECKKLKNYFLSIWKFLKLQRQIVWFKFCYKKFLDKLTVQIEIYAINECTFWYCSPSFLL